VIAWVDATTVPHTVRQASPTSSPVLALDVAGNTVRPNYLKETIRFTYLVISAHYAHLLTSTSSKVGRDTTVPTVFDEPTEFSLSSKAILVSHPVLIGLKPPSKGSDHFRFTHAPRSTVLFKQAIEVRAGQQGVKAKWVRIELRKVEVLPGGGQAGTFFDYVGQSPINLWTGPDGEYGILRPVRPIFFSSHSFWSRFPQRRSSKISRSTSVSLNRYLQQLPSRKEVGSDPKPPRI